MFAVALLLAAGTAAAQTRAANPDCTLIVPDDPLTAQGLAAPYQLVATHRQHGPCNESNPDQSAFVQAAILDPATGQIAIYNPLVVDRGALPAAAPVVPKLPANAVVALWFGYNGDNLTLRGSGTTLQDNGCVNGANGSVFGQFAYCNAPAFFRAAHRAIRNGQLKVPPLGVAKDGMACPSVRDFFAVDQDQSDNLPTSYLLTNRGRMAQANKANKAKFPDAELVGNPSDNGLVDTALDGVLGCAPWKAPDLADPGKMVPALPLNELQARMFQSRPVARVPASDPMVLSDGDIDLDKLNAYRRGVDQPVVASAADADTARYCRNMFRIAPARLAFDQRALAAAPSPDADAANSLFTFLAQRFVGSYDILGCADLIGKADPVAVKTNADGVTLSATINVSQFRLAAASLASSQTQDQAAPDCAQLGAIDDPATR
jgi:hypothetical protein